MFLLYTIGILSLVIGGYAVYQDRKWKNSMLQEVQNINICAFSANHCMHKLLRRLELEQEDEEEFLVTI